MSEAGHSTAEVASFNCNIAKISNYISQQITTLVCYT